MAYDRWFNNTMAIFTAFGGGIEMDIPELNWSRVYADHFGFEADEAYIYQNGLVSIALSSSTYDSSKSNWISSFNTNSGEWEPTGVQLNSLYTICHGGYGLFLAHKFSSNPSQNSPYDYRSVDGVNWQLFGYNSRGSMDLATNGRTAVAAIWHTDTPYCYSTNVHAYKTMTICSIPKAFSQTVTCNSKIYVLRNDNDSSLFTSCDDGVSFVRTIQYPHGCDASTYTKGIYPACVCNDKIFISAYQRDTEEDVFVSTFGLLNQNGTDYTEIVRNEYPDEKYTTMHSCSVLYIESIGKYLGFFKGLYVSNDCIHWTERPDLLPTADDYYFAWYVKGKGIYCRCGDYPAVYKTYFAPLP